MKGSDKQTHVLARNQNIIWKARARARWLRSRLYSVFPSNCFSSFSGQQKLQTTSAKKPCQQAKDHPPPPDAGFLTRSQRWHITVVRQQTWNWDSLSVTLTDGADYAGVARCDWLLVDVQETEMLQEGVSHTGVKLLALDERVRQCHHIGVAPDASYNDRETLSVGWSWVMKLYCQLHLWKPNEPNTSDRTKRTISVSIAKRNNTEYANIKR